MINLVPRAQHDDIARLEQHLGMPNLGYRDIGASLERDRAIQRWPLLSELSIIADLASACNGIAREPDVSSIEGKRLA